MTPSLFTSAARWIWSTDATRPFHNIVCFRHTFRVGKDLAHARLLISADARYEVFVNGEWLGHGPPRAWESPWPVDPYDLQSVLHPGDNVIAVRVQDLGIGTFQYLNASPGLLAQVEWQDESGKRQLVTDRSWMAKADPGYLWPVPRVSCQQGWEEQYDARTALSAWWEPSYQPALWPRSTELRAAGEGAHATFTLRDIPQLTREPVSAIRVRSVEAVRTATYSWSLNPRAFLNPTDKTANFVRGNMLLLTHVHSAKPQKISFHPPHHRPELVWKLNGRTLLFSDHSALKTDTGCAHARLKKGWNVLCVTLPPEEHFWWAVLNVWTEQPVRWAAYPDDRPTETPWLAIGPFGDPLNPTQPPTSIHKVMVDAERIPNGATLERFEAIRSRGSLAAADYLANFVRPLARHMLAPHDVYAVCASERTTNGPLPLVENPHSLLHDTADWTMIHPVMGADVRILLDFGKELIGYHEFEVDAPAGAIIDNHNFEFIQPDGRFNLAESMNNSFRYVCREGVQRYRTLLRRGFQYSWFSFRNFNRPIRVRFVRVLMSTYPQAGQGAFACSDDKLSRIWEAGAHSVRCCSEDTYTDCPTYEQTFWVGDARNEALVDFVVNGDPRLSAHSWNLAAQSLDRSDLVESQVPSAWENILPAWSFLWMRWAEEHHRFAGDKRLALHMVRQIERNVAGIENNLSERGLFRIRAWNMFDWAPLDTPPDGEITHLNALAVLGLRQSVRLAKTIGAKAQAAAWSSLADRLVRAINLHLWDEKKRAYIDCIRPDGTRSPIFSQQTHTAVYIAQAATGRRLARSREIMAKAPKDFIQAGSPFFMFFVLEGLAREGRFAELTQTVRSYWGKQIDAGATTFWETYHADQERMTRSHCHGWSAAPTYFLSHDILGIQPATPGFSSARIAPQLVGLSWARGRMPTPRGPIEVSWTYERRTGRFDLCATLPKNLPAVIELPVTGSVEVISGKLRRIVTSSPAVRFRTSGGDIHLVCVENKNPKAK
jgi:hypothetical protein